MPTRETYGNRVQRATKLAYAVGALSDSIKTSSFSLFLLFYYTTVLGLPGTWIGLAMAVGLIWDASVDPLIGRLSDRAVHMRLGRRHSFMLAGSVCAGASFIAVFNPPGGLSTPALFAWLVLSSLCLRSSNSLFMVPYYALGSELTADYHERTSISAYRTATVLVGTLATTAAAFLVFLPNAQTPGADGQFAAGGYASLGVAFGLAIAAAGLAATWGTLREGRHLSASPARTDAASAVGRDVFAPLRVRPLRVLIVSSALSFMGTAVNAALLMHFLTYHVRVAASETISVYFAMFYVGALAGVPLWVRASRTLEKHHVYAGATVAAGFVFSTGYWLVGAGRPFGTGDSWILYPAYGLAGLFGAAGSVIVPSMMADITAYDGRRTGCRRDGVFFGLYSFSQQLAGGLAVLVAGVLVDRFAGLAPGQAQQSPVTIERLAMLASLLPAAMLAIAGLAALRYGLTREALQSVQEEIATPASRGPAPATAPAATVPN